MNMSTVKHRLELLLHHLQPKLSCTVFSDVEDDHHHFKNELKIDISAEEGNVENDGSMQGNKPKLSKSKRIPINMMGVDFELLQNFEQSLDDALVQYFPPNQNYHQSILKNGIEMDIENFENEGNCELLYRIMPKSFIPFYYANVINEDKILSNKCKEEVHLFIPKKNPKKSQYNSNLINKNNMIKTFCNLVKKNQIVLASRLIDDVDFMDSQKYIILKLIIKLKKMEVKSAKFEIDSMNIKSKSLSSLFCYIFQDHHASKILDEMCSEIEVILRSNPSSEKQNIESCVLYYILALYCFKKNRWIPCKIFCEHALYHVTCYPDIIAQVMSLFAWMWNKGYMDYERSEQIFTTAMQQYPHEIDIHLEYAKFLWQFPKRKMECIKIVEDIVHNHPQCRFKHLNYFLFYSYHGKSPKSFEQTLGQWSQKILPTMLDYYFGLQFRKNTANPYFTIGTFSGERKFRDIDLNVQLRPLHPLEIAFMFLCCGRYYAKYLNQHLQAIELYHKAQLIEMHCIEKALKLLELSMCSKNSQLQEHFSILSQQEDNMIVMVYRMVDDSNIFEMLNPSLMSISKETMNYFRSLVRNEKTNDQRMHAIG